MFYLKDDGRKMPIECDNVFTVCPECGAEVTVDLADVVTEEGLDLYGLGVYCDACGDKIHPMWEHMDQLEAIAARYPETGLTQIQQHVKSGLLAGLPLETVLVGVRVALARESGKEELFSLGDVAAALGCTKEEATAEMERQGIAGMKVSTLPGFDWLLQ